MTADVERGLCGLCRNLSSFVEARDGELDVLVTAIERSLETA